MRMKMDKRVIKDIKDGVSLDIIEVRYVLDCKHLDSCGAGACIGCGIWSAGIEERRLKLIGEKE